MSHGYRQPLFVLAFDHRTSLQRDLFHTTGESSLEEALTISKVKELIYEGLERSIHDGVPRDSAAFLIDERFGTEVARKADASGIAFALAVERSGRKEFEFEYGSGFGSHIEKLNPTFCKALLRYNPEGNRALNKRQSARLSTFSEWLDDRTPKLMVELLVPPEDSQLRAVEDDAGRYDRELRPALMMTAIAELQDAGVEADVWKIEGMDSRQDCEAVAAVARSGGRDDVGCVILGRGADDETVEAWLKQVAELPGYIGFAVGRTIWWDAVRNYLNGDDRERSVQDISDRYRHFIDVYTSAG